LNGAYRSRFPSTATCVMEPLMTTRILLSPKASA